MQNPVAESKNNYVAARLKAMYSKPFYVSLWARIRLGHAGYDFVEQHVPSSGKVLDLGCGYGLFCNYLGLTSEQRRVTGVELNGRKLRHADKGLKNVSFKNSDILAEPVTDYYDCIVLLHVLHHLKSFMEQEAIVSKCVQMLNSGGRLVVLEVDDHPLSKYWLAHVVDHLLYPMQKIFYRLPESMEKLLRGVGLAVESYPMHKGRPFPHFLYVGQKI